MSSTSNMPGASDALIPDAVVLPAAQSVVGSPGETASCPSCGHDAATVNLMPPGHHQYAELRCPACRHHRWLPRPKDKIVDSPFVVLVDSREQRPYTFDDLYTNADQGNALIRVRTRRQALAVGDYSISSDPRLFIDLNNPKYKPVPEYPGVVVERKSKEDLYNSVAQRRANFEDRLRRMASEYAAAAVVVECEVRELLMDPPPHTRFHPKAMNRTLTAWRIRFAPVQWFFMPDRESAGTQTYRYLEMFHAMTARGENAHQESYERWRLAGFPGIPGGHPVARVSDVPSDDSTADDSTDPDDTHPSPMPED